MKTTLIYIIMGQKKGQTGNPKGRPKGVPNKVTGTVKEWIATIIDGNREQFEKDLKALEAGERVRVISNLLQYVTPKIQSTSPEELLDAEYKRLEELLDIAPDEAIILIAERVKEGLEASKKRGKRLDRPKLEKEKLSIALRMYDSKEYSIKEIVEGTGVSQGSLYRAINQRKLEET